MTRGSRPPDSYVHADDSLVPRCGCRYHGDDVAWQYVGSHNLSKAAWGQLQKNASQLMCRRCGQTWLGWAASLRVRNCAWVLCVPQAHFASRVGNKSCIERTHTVAACQHNHNLTSSPCSYELGVLLVPSLEAAYRASRWVGFSCTSDAPMPGAATAAAAADGGAAAAAAAAEGQAGGAAAAAAAGPAASQPAPTVRFVAWKRGDSQEAQEMAAGEGASGSSSGGSDGGGVQRELLVPLPIPYSLPPQKYQPGDEAWMVDRHYSGGCPAVRMFHMQVIAGGLGRSGWGNAVHQSAGFAQCNRGIQHAFDLGAAGQLSILLGRLCAGKDILGFDIDHKHGKVSGLSSGDREGWPPQSSRSSYTPPAWLMPDVPPPSPFCTTTNGPLVQHYGWIGEAQLPGRVLGCSMTVSLMCNPPAGLLVRLLPP